MAEIDVQPKKRSGSILPWILLALGVIALLIFLFRNKDGDDRSNEARNNDEKATYNSTTSNAAAAGAWSSIDWNAPETRYDEINGNDVTVRGNEGYSIYGVGEDILFDTDAATLKSSAEASLRQIASSIDKRYNGGEVRVFGFTDAKGSSEHNQQLSAQRAEAVKAWLVQQGKIDAGRISVQPQGEANPQATNATAEGRQQNRRVEIVARKNA
jgi:outer membrane protein OmpA-like peptidoglycan-associated protein